MKPFLSVGLVVALSLLLVPAVSQAAREDVSLSTGTQITANGVTLTVFRSEGALLDSVAVGSATITLIMSPDTRFMVRSADRRAITATNLGTVKESSTCSSSLSEYLYENPASAGGAATVTLTVESSTCSTSGGGAPGGTGAPGGGGGGGGYTYVPPAPEPTPTTPAIATVPVTPAVTAIPAPAAKAIGATIERALSKGMTNPSVKTLQQILNSDPDTSVAEMGPGSPGNESDFFGSATLKAVQKFQVKYGIAKPGDSGYGTVGPLTRTVLNSLSGAPAAAVPAAMTASASTASVPGTITRPLSKGMTNVEVKSVQQILNSDPDTRVAETGPGSPGNESNFFGPATLKAVQKFQEKHGLAGPGENGYGNVGPKTRAKLNELAGSVQ